MAVPAVGANSTIIIHPETTWGVTPTEVMSVKVPAVSYGMKGTQALIDNPQLSSDPNFRDPALGKNDSAGSWSVVLDPLLAPQVFKMFTGQLATTYAVASGTHTSKLAAGALPSYTIQRTSDFATDEYQFAKGVVAESFKISAAVEGFLQAELGLVGGPITHSTTPLLSVTPTTKTITAATNATPVVVTSAGHGLSNDTWVLVTGVLGATGANGLWQVKSAATDTFALGTASVAGGDYTSGGTIHISPIDLTAGVNPFESGQLNTSGSGVVTITSAEGGSTAQTIDSLMEWSMEINNNLYKDGYTIGSMDRRFLTRGKSKVSGSMKFFYDKEQLGAASTDDIYAIVTNRATKQPCVIVLKWYIDANTYFELTLPRVFLERTDPSLDDEGPETLSVNYTSTYSTTGALNSSVKFVIKNSYPGGAYV